MKKLLETKYMKFLRVYYLYFILMVGLVGTIVSIYFSEFMELPPCDLCWYQRVFFYPIPVIAFIAIWVKDQGAYRYILPLALIGAPISLYHHLLKVTSLFPKDTPFCGEAGACSEVEWELFSGSGITIPLLALAGFMAIIGLCVIKLVTTSSQRGLSIED